jgi:hypothetical protein
MHGAVSEPDPRGKKNALQPPMQRVSEFRLLLEIRLLRVFGRRLFSRLFDGFFGFFDDLDSSVVRVGRRVISAAGKHSHHLGLGAQQHVLAARRIEPNAGERRRNHNQKENQTTHNPLLVDPAARRLKAIARIPKNPCAPGKLLAEPEWGEKAARETGAKINLKARRMGHAGGSLPV